MVCCCSYSSYLQAFSFLDQNAADHYRSLRQELNPKKDSGDTSVPKVAQKCPDTTSANEKKDAGIRKQVDLMKKIFFIVIISNMQVSLNDEIFFAERHQEAEAIRDKVHQKPQIQFDQNYFIKRCDGNSLCRLSPAENRDPHSRLPCLPPRLRLSLAGSRKSTEVKAREGLQRRKGRGSDGQEGTCHKTR